MRLIDTTGLELREFNPSAIPPYAILSHTWGDDEVSLQDMSSPTVSQKKGYDKIIWTCTLARNKRIRFAWIDTCCIDKSSSAELTEAINSMFEWYRKAEVCYAFLSDVPSRPLTASRWFTRGWTLQELIAPAKLEFYDKTWEYIGSKLDSPFLGDIERYTNIPEKVLRGSASPDLYPVATRMSWAASRQTTRVEDKAYCLLGLFGVHMPMIYGEGEIAFRRLQEELIKRNNDLTIFAWDCRVWEQQRPWTQPSSDSDGTRLGWHTVAPLFAPTPAAFANSATIPFTDDFLEFSLSNKGLASKVVIRVLRMPDNRYTYGIFPGALPYRHSDGTTTLITAKIILRKIGPGFFFRWATYCSYSNPNLLAAITVVNTLAPSFSHHILVDSSAAHRVPFQEFREDAIHIPNQAHDIQLEQTSPEHLWDETDRMFLQPSAHKKLRGFPMSLLAWFKMSVPSHQQPVRFLVLCNYRDGFQEPSCLIAEYDFACELGLLLNGNMYEMSQPFQDIVQKFPRSANWTSSFWSSRAEARISVSAEKNEIKCACIHSLIPVFSLTIHVEPS